MLLLRLLLLRLLLPLLRTNIATPGWWRAGLTELAARRDSPQSHRTAPPQSHRCRGVAEGCGTDDG